VFDYHVAESIAVLEARDKPMPIGIASTIGRTEGGLAVWGRRPGPLGGR